ncbi:MAG: FAD-dependent oxidoreductase [Vulcanimicrobiota bacterium]
MKILIVGGVAGGATAAARLRRLNEDAEITLYERGKYISFANCGLPYHLGGVIKEKKSLLVQTPEAMEARFAIKVKTLHEVTEINRTARKITVKNIATGETFEDGYDCLILSPGSRPLKPPIPGADSPHVLTLQTIPDMERILMALDGGARSAVVAGGGYIGIEAAENLAARGLDVSLVEMRDQVLLFLDPDMAAYSQEELRAHGILLHLGNKVKEIRDPGEGKVVVSLSDGAELEADFVVMALGVTPEVTLAEKAGIKLGKTGAIEVNEHMQTSDPSIYAVGDAAEVTNFVTGAKARIPLAGPANRQARIAANHISGIQSTYKKTLGTSIIKVFELACAATGAGEEALTASGIPHRSVTIHSGSHAGYYPGAYPIHLKLIYSPADGKILGAQACGYDGVDKRIDILATSIRHGATVYDVEDYELAYAPPFGSAKDPVNMAAFVAVNDLRKLAPVATIFDVDSIKKNGAVLLDVRNPEEVRLGTIEGALNIPLNNLRARMSEISGEKEVLVFCKVGLRGYIAQRILIQNGFKAINLTGGYESYKAYRDRLKGNPARPKEIADDQQTSPPEAPSSDSPSGKVIKIDASGLACPGPLMKLKENSSEAKAGDIIEIESTDKGFYNDVQSCASSMNLKILELVQGKTIKARLQKCSDEACASIKPAQKSDQVTIVVFSNDLDKALASFIIANGALSMGKQVSMFFTFWGLNVLRRDAPVKVNKNFIEKMFSLMMPRGAQKLVLSKMHMLGMGTAMIRDIMKKQSVTPLEGLISSFQQKGGKLIGCTMTMDMMGIRKEELVEGVEEGGVATFLSDADKGHITLFI